jgi:uncharacterized protein (DUF488 family)
MKAFTIGYGGCTPSELLTTLDRHSIRSIVDIRIWPMRASMGSYVLAKDPDKGIQGLLARAGIGYQSFLELGNPYKDHANWKDQYRRLIDIAGGVLIERLLEVPVPLCLLCAEKYPCECHRLILAEFLAKYGWEIEHLVP